MLVGEEVPGLGSPSPVVSPNGNTPHGDRQMTDENILTCPYCENRNIREVSSVIHEPYPDKELIVYKCKDCGRVFHEGEMGE